MDCLGARIRISDEGRVEVIDPGFADLPLLQEIDPSFRVRRSPLPNFSTPRFLKTRNLPMGVTRQELTSWPEKSLWTLHRLGVDLLHKSSTVYSLENDEASLLDVKIEIGYRLLKNCILCGHRCGVDRTIGERGRCLLGEEAVAVKYYVHIAEEASINPSLLVYLAGCGLRCRYCQQGDLQNPEMVVGEPIEEGLWDRLPLKGARSLSFIGGNPDESLPAILRFLSTAPDSWSLPIVWNCHGYGSLEAVALLAGVVDAYLPDIKYGDPDCGLNLSAAPNYPSLAYQALEAMLTHGVPVLVRHLVLPGHYMCCQAPLLNFLSIHRENPFLQLSIRDQYCPDWLITDNDGLLTRRVSPSEVKRVCREAQELGLSLVEA
uniref:Radical SAM protein n=1 Tax=Desulfobacca acetoxidans TaxID=60893 RepID=A0A7V4LD07_9BACT